VPTNIAEGARRSAPKEYAHFLSIAQGSLSETEYLVLVSRELGHISLDSANRCLAETAELLKMLNALRKKVRDDSSDP
jgi:four helix bundle protein